MKKYEPITAAELMPLQEFEKKRPIMRQEIIALKRHRRVPVGPDVSFYFENRQTLLWQIQEMLYIEKGGDAQVQDELLAYNSLVPKGNELVATFMIEVDDIQRRAFILRQLQSIEKSVTLNFGAYSIEPEPETEIEREDATGKTSAVHFLHFSFSKDAAQGFLNAGEVTLTIAHPHYSYSTVLDAQTHAALKNDL